MSSFDFLSIYLSCNLSKNVFLLLEHSHNNTDDIAEEVTGMPCMSNLIVIHWSDVICQEAIGACNFHTVSVKWRFHK